MTALGVAARRTDLAERFARRLQEARKAKGISQSKLAEVLDLDHSYVSRLENGERLPGIELQERLAEFFGLSLDELMGRT